MGVRWQIGTEEKADDLRWVKAVVVIVLVAI
jgi:hypothetical protein